LRTALTGAVGHDDVEHLHSAWLVQQGLDPYLDFFQKQSPLFWHMLRPILALSGDSFAAALFLGRGLMLLFLASTILAAWKLASAPRTMLYLLLASPVLIYNLAAIRPDGPMVTLLLWAAVLLARATAPARKAVGSGPDGGGATRDASAADGRGKGDLRPSSGWPLAIGAGLLLGTASVLLLKAVPFALAISIAACFLVPRKRLPALLGSIALGAAVPVAAFAAWLWSAGLLEGFWFFNVVFNSHLYSHPPVTDLTWTEQVFENLRFEIAKEPWVPLLALLAPVSSLVLFSSRKPTESSAVPACPPTGPRCARATAPGGGGGTEPFGTVVPPVGLLPKPSVGSIGPSRSPVPAAPSGAVPAAEPQALGGRVGTQVISLALWLAGIALLLRSGLPFYSYLQLPFLAGLLLAAPLLERVLRPLSGKDLVLTSGTKELFRLSTSTVLVWAAALAVLGSAVYRHSTFSSSEAQIEKIESLDQRLPEYKLPFHPVFAFDRYRIWDNRERYIQTFRELDAQGRIPAWAKDIYAAEYSSR